MTSEALSRGDSAAAGTAEAQIRVKAQKIKRYVGLRIPSNENKISYHYRHRGSDGGEENEATQRTIQSVEQ